MKIRLKKSSCFSAAACMTALMVCLFHTHAAKADFTTGTASSAPHGLQNALTAQDGFNLYDGRADGFNLAGGFFSGRASGINYTYDHSAELEDDQHVYAVLVDGRYDFNYDGGADVPLHPYLLGGMGMAMLGGGAPSASALAMQSGDMASLVRVGGGMIYHLADQLDMSLDYKAGFSGLVGEQAFAGRSLQPVDTHVVNVGMHFQF